MESPDQCPKCNSRWFVPAVGVRLYRCPGCQKVFDLTVSPPRELNGDQSGDAFFDPTDPAGILTMFPPEDEGMG